MTAINPRMWTVILLLVMVAGPAWAQAPEAKVEAEKAEEKNPLLDPAAATLTAPEEFKVKVETTSGDFVIQVHREWAPNGADRFYNLVKMGYYADCAFFRVIDNFMAQVGYHGDPEVTRVWASATIEDDPIRQHNSRGMVTFAQRSLPNSRTTQFFINYKDNSYLRQHGNFAPFGEVIEGMDVVDSLYSGYGEGAPQGRGPSQASIAQQGNTYLREKFSKLDYILSTTIVGE